MRLIGTQAAQEKAKALRATMSLPEVTLCQALRRKGCGLRFRRQHAAGAYGVDFFCAPARLAIEVDGEARPG